MCSLAGATSGGTIAPRPPKAAGEGGGRGPPAVGAALLVVVLPAAAVEPEPAQPLGQGVVLDQHHAGVAPGAEILAGEKGEGAGPAGLPREAPRPVHPRAPAAPLRCVLDGRDV